MNLSLSPENLNFVRDYQLSPLVEVSECYVKSLETCCLYAG